MCKCRHTDKPAALFAKPASRRDNHMRILQKFLEYLPVGLHTGHLDRDDEHNAGWLWKEEMEDWVQITTTNGNC